MNVRVPVLLALALTACAGGDDSGDGADPAPERCDRGVNTAAFNEATHIVDRIEGHSHAMQAGEVDFTVREWAEIFVDPTLGPSVDQVTEAIEGNAAMKSVILGGVIADTLEPDPWVPLTDPEACAALAAELTRAREAAARYPTAVDALADGFTAGSVYVPGKGAHFSKRANIADGFDPDHPDMLMYDSLEPDAQLMGMSYFVISPEGVGEDEGFTGASDQWHSHDSNCTDDAGVAIAPTECEAGRGNLQTGMNGWMLHAWVVPGCESDWGVFSGTNPALPSLPPGDSPLTSGCNTGKTVADPVTMDDAGDGPRVA